VYVKTIWKLGESSFVFGVLPAPPAPSDASGLADFLQMRDASSPLIRECSRCIEALAAIEYGDNFPHSVRHGVSPKRYQLSADLCALSARTRALQTDAQINDVAMYKTQKIFGSMLEKTIDQCLGLIDHQTATRSVRSVNQSFPPLILAQNINAPLFVRDLIHGN
jgi:hypothetical protein